MVSIKIVTIGRMPAELNLRLLSKWKSKIFLVSSDIECFALNSDSDGFNWEFSDENIEKHLPREFSENFLVAIVNVPIENNWYSRRLKGNKVVFSYFQIKDILQNNNLPLENVIYRLLYAYTLLYKRSGNKIPKYDENINFTHDETRGCLFDMNGIKTDVVYSCHRPIICDECSQRLRNDNVSENVIYSAKEEIKKITKPLFFRIGDFVKKYPILSLLVSILVALLVDTVGSLLSTFIYELLI